MLKSKEFQRYVMPIAVINSIFCTGFLEYFADKSTQVIGFVYVICAVIGYCKGFSVLVKIINTSWRKHATGFEQFMIHFQFCHNIIIYVLSILAGIIRRKRVQLSMRQLENCARAMDELGIPESYSPMISHKYLVVLSFCFLFVALVISELYFMGSDNNSFVVVLYCLMDSIPAVGAFVIDFSFVYWVRFAKIKLGQLNTVLRNMLTTTIDSPQHRRVLRLTGKWKDSSTSSNISPNSKANENVRKLKRIMHIHLEVIKYARNTNKAFGLHILMSMTTCFLLITSLLYSLYFSISSSRWTLKSLDTFIFTFWIIFLVIELFFVNNTCEVTKMEVRKFTYQIVQNPLTFSAWGFFDLDHTFINSIIGSVTTYLVILIQIGHGSKKDSMNSTENSTSII